jgi:hypothetical protein
VIRSNGLKLPSRSHTGERHANEIDKRTPVAPALSSVKVSTNATKATRTTPVRRYHGRACRRPRALGMVKTFADEFHRELNRQASKQDARRDCVTRDLAKTEREIGRVIEAIKEGVPGTAVKDEMKALEARRSDLVDQLKGAPPAVPRLHPNVAAVYREKIAGLREALNAEDTRTEAATK